MHIWTNSLSWIAIMLGRLKMTDEQCKETFRTYTETIFRRSRWLYHVFGCLTESTTSKYSGKRLARATQDVIESFDPQPESEKLSMSNRFAAAPGLCRWYSNIPQQWADSNVRTVELELLPSSSHSVPQITFYLMFFVLTIILPQVLETPERLINVTFGMSHWQRPLLQGIFQLSKLMEKNIPMVVLGSIIRAMRHITNYYSCIQTIPSAWWVLVQAQIQLSPDFGPWVVPTAAGILGREDALTALKASTGWCRTLRINMKNHPISDSTSPVWNTSPLTNGLSRVEKNGRRQERCIHSNLLKNRQLSTLQTTKHVPGSVLAHRCWPTVTARCTSQRSFFRLENLTHLRHSLGFGYPRWNKFVLGCVDGLNPRWIGIP